jgi:hypothetical protein
MSLSQEKYGFVSESEENESIILSQNSSLYKKNSNIKFVFD